MNLDLLKRTPLHALHVERGARMVPFAGHAMPLHYPAGIVAEHLHTRQSAGLFDVSHMGQLQLTSADGREAVAKAIEGLVPMDALGQRLGRQCYGLLLDDDGGIVDDLMIAHLSTHLVAIVNAANVDADIGLLRDHLAAHIKVTLLPDALLAIQGPLAEAILARLAPECVDMAFMDVRRLDLIDVSCLVMRSGYTGEDGFEISVSADHAETIARALLEDERLGLVGLGARDTLRLEAGLCLHGADIDATTTPVEADLGWTIASARRAGGARAGGFPGAERILTELANGTSRRRVALRGCERTPIRAHTHLFADVGADEPIGMVTSGSFSPSLQTPIAMGYVTTPFSAAGTRLFAEVRGRRLEVCVSALPFVPARFKRGHLPPASERDQNAQIH